MSENYEEQNELDLNEGSLRRGVEAVTDTAQAVRDRFNRKLSPQERYEREVDREKRKAGRNRERDDETLRNILKTEKSVKEHGVLGGKAIMRMLKREGVEQMNEARGYRGLTRKDVHKIARQHYGDEVPGYAHTYAKRLEKHITEGGKISSSIDRHRVANGGVTPDARDVSGPDHNFLKSVHIEVKRRMKINEEYEQQMNEGVFDATKRAVRNKSKELLYDYDKVPDPTNVKNTVRGMVNVAGGLGAAAARGLATDARRAARKVFGKKEKGVKEDMMSVDTKDIIESIANQNRPKSDIKEMVYAVLSDRINGRLDECKAVIAENYFGQHEEYFGKK